MKITNKHKLPESIYNVISKVRKPSEDRISVTELIDSPLIRRLRMEHWGELEEDASERLWALLGTSVHYALEKGTPLDAFGEERLEVMHSGIVISGQSDLYHNEGIEDYKVTSVYAFLLGMNPQWTAQLNVYKWLWEEQNYPVKTLKIHAILRDWMQSKALREPDYPPIPFITVDLPVWSHEDTEAYITERLDLHFDPEIRECTPEEKWARPTTYAVVKKGKKRAKRVLDSWEDAEKWIEENGDDKLNIEVRQGLNVRCESFCPVREFCPFMKGE